MTGEQKPGGLEAIISDEEIVRVHGHANFGPTMTPRDVVNEGVRKYAVGYTSGYTQLTILLEHGLITKPRPGRYEASLTKKGKRYARALGMYHAIDRATAAEAQLAKAKEALEPFAKLARVRYPEEGGAPSWIDLMTNNGECDELELRSHVALDRDRAQLLDAADFRGAAETLAALQQEGE